MKYPMEYWTGRMSGMLVGLAKHKRALDDNTKESILKLVADFEEDSGFKREDK